MNRRNFIRIIGLATWIDIYELRASTSLSPLSVIIPSFKITFPLWLINPRSKHHLQRIALSTLTLASPNYQLKFSNDEFVQLEPNSTPAMLLALNQGNTSRQYMLLKRFLSYMLYRILSDIELFQNEEVIEHVSPAQITTLWMQYQSTPKVSKVIWNDGKGFVVR